MKTNTELFHYIEELHQAGRRIVYDSSSPNLDPEIMREDEMERMVGFILDSERGDGLSRRYEILGEGALVETILDATVDVLKDDYVPDYQEEKAERFNRLVNAIKENAISYYAPYVQKLLDTYDCHFGESSEEEKLGVAYHVD
jgi:hypothetical protein